MEVVAGRAALALPPPVLRQPRKGGKAMLEALKSIARKILRPPVHRPDIALPLTLLGTRYGGWPLLADTPRGALVFSFGVGDDISFDLGAIERFNCRVHGFDPTPRCLSWASRQAFPDGFTFHPVGIAARDGEVEFFEPEVERHMSFSAGPSDGTGKRSVTAPVWRLATAIQKVGAGVPDVVKMDVEGFEYEVLPEILVSSIRPRQLMVEFHHGLYGFDTSHTNAAVAALKAAGYRLYFVSDGGREYAFTL